MPSIVTILASLPVLVLVIFSILPASLTDPYAWVDPISLNTNAPDGRSMRWFNMGYWDGTDDFSSAAEQLGRELLRFANAPTGGSVLDIAHGSGESLLLHLSSPRSHIDAIAAIPADTARARALVMAHKVNQSISTEVKFHTGSAVPQLERASDQTHPLNPMKGFLGNSGELDGGYNLIYILDAIYHFPPSLHDFLTRTLKVLAPGGVIAYTDILPPPRLNYPTGYILSKLLQVPTPNLTSRPSGLTEYRINLEKLGYVNVDVRDWSGNVWPGFSRNLLSRGGGWPLVGGLVRRAEQAGWKFVAVRASRPQ